MVVTRGQHTRAGTRPIPGNAQQRMRRARRWIKRYSPTDSSHRHRLPDRQPKGVRVTSYTRRS